MYGISNSQQQGGGGGSAASYKAIKSTIAPSDWQEVATQPYFVGSNVMEWTVNDNEDYEKSQTTKLGLVAGNSYTITAVCDGQTYTQTAVAEGDEANGIAISYDLSPQVSMFVDIYDDNTGSKCVIYVEATSFVITKFEGEGFGTKMQATISDSAIKVNSAVTMYTNTSEKIAVGGKTNGNVTLIAPSIPTTDIPYSLEIVGTDTEGLFELINGYVPEIPSVSSNYDDFSNIPIINQDLSESGFTAVKDTYYRHTGTTNRDYTNGVIYKCVDVGSTSKPLRLFELSTIYDVQMTINEAVAPLLPSEKDITNESTNVSITGSASPYLFTVTDSGVSSYKFVRLYPMDDDTETWLNEHTLSSIITEESGKFTFKVDTNTLPTAYSIKYVIESFM